MKERSKYRKVLASILADLASKTRRYYETLKKIERIINTSKHGDTLASKTAHGIFTSSTTALTWTYTEYQVLIEVLSDELNIDADIFGLPQELEGGKWQFVHPELLPKDFIQKIERLESRCKALICEGDIPEIDEFAHHFLISWCSSLSFHLVACDTKLYEEAVDLVFYQLLTTRLKRYFEYEFPGESDRIMKSMLGELGVLLIPRKIAESMEGAFRKIELDEEIEILRELKAPQYD